MGMFDYKDYSSSESIELLETSYRLATYANINGFLDRCDVLQVKGGNIPFFHNYGNLNRVHIQADFYIII